MSSRSLPDGWREMPLADAARYINGRAFKPSEWKKTGLPIIRIQNLNDPRKPFNYFDDEYEQRHYVDNGDILISWSASLGVYVWDRGPALLNQHIFKVLPCESLVDRGYFVYAVQTILERMKDRVHGSTMKHIVKRDFESLTIPVPPIPVQRKIAETLDRGMRLMGIRDQANLFTTELVRSVFLEMFGDPDANPMNWELKELGQLIECLDSQRVPVKESERKKGNVPYYGANGRVGWIDGFLFDEHLLLLAEDGGNWGKFQQCAYRIRGRSWVNNHAHVLRETEQSKLEFLEVLLNISDLTRHISGSTRGKLTQTMMNRILVPTPPLDLQRRFVSSVEKVEALRDIQNQSTREIDELFHSLMHKAFRGEAQYLV